MSAAQVEKLKGIAAELASQMREHYVSRAQAKEFRVEMHATDAATLDIGDGKLVSIHMINVMDANQNRSVYAVWVRLIIANLPKELVNEFLEAIRDDDNFGVYNEGLSGVVYCNYRFATDDHTNAIIGILGPEPEPQRRRPVL